MASQHVRRDYVNSESLGAIVTECAEHLKEVRGHNNRHST
jgi:hypothetical protein